MSGNFPRILAQPEDARSGEQRLERKMLQNGSRGGVCPALPFIGDKHMKRFSNALFSVAVLSAVLFGLSATADAQRRTEREVRDAVRTLNSQIDDLKYDLEFQARNNAGGQILQDATRGLENLKVKVAAFDDNVTKRRENRDDINEIVTAAKDVEGALRGASVNRSIRDNWAEAKRTIDSLATKYGVTPDWSGRVSNAQRGTYPSATPVRASAGGLTGTYRLDTAKSESVADVLSSTGVGGTQRQDLETKLEAPEEIAILVSGGQVTLASSKASPISFVADGRDKTETTGGRTIRTRSTLRGQELTVSSLGGETDYTVKFISTDNGNTLKVTRRITTDYLRETIFAESVYTKTDAVAGLGIDSGAVQVSDDAYSSNDPQDRNPGYGGNPSVITPRIGEFIVPNGVTVAAVLDNPIDTKVSQNNDRFRMTVQSPDEFRGAIIEGYISGVGRSGQVSGRPNVTFNFTKITLRDGKEYDFAGSLTGIKDAFGKDVKVDSEGTAKGDSQTRETAKRGGIGAGAGALIGAILGGGKGAAIGAIIGGGAGAGSVIAQGRDDIKLQQGSVVTVVSSSPIRRDQQQISENN